MKTKAAVTSVHTELGKIKTTNQVARSVGLERYQRMNNKQVVLRAKIAMLDLTIHMKGMMDLVHHVRKQKQEVKVNVLGANQANTKTVLKKQVIVMLVVLYAHWVNFPTIVT